MIYQPWLAHNFPGVTLGQLHAGDWSLGVIVAMADFVRDQTRDAV